MDIRETDSSYFFQVKWEGLPDKMHFTWQEADTLYTDVPDIMKTYLQNLTTKRKLRQKVCDFLKISLWKVHS